MTALVFAATIVAGGAGSGLRYLVDNLVSRRTSGRFPWGTTVVNTTGSFVLGFLTGLATTNLIDAAWLTILGTGVIGGYTTFSTASVETVRLLLARRIGAAAFNGFGMIVLCVFAAYAGLIFGRLLGRLLF